MLILSSFNNDKKFIEIVDIAECQNIESDCYVYISIDSIFQKDLEKYFQIGKLLYQNEVEYAILLNSRARFYLNQNNNKHNRVELMDNNGFLTEEKVSLQLILSMFARYGASFCIFDENNYDLLALAQSYANYHLFDMKIMGLVSSYMQSGCISSWHHRFNNKVDKFIHIDGAIESSLLVRHETKN